MRVATLRLRTAALVAVALALAACAGAPASARPSAQPTAAGGSGTAASGATASGAAASGAAVGSECTETYDVQLGYHSISQSVWPMWIAEEQGIFDKYGINAELINAEGARILSGVISKATPIAFASGADILDPIAEGADIVPVFAFEGGTPTDMIVSTAEITDPQQLKGKVAGANELGGESDSLVRLGLREMGLEPDVDTRVLSVGGESTRIAALKSNQVQATLVDAGLRQEMIDQGFNILYDFTESDFKLLKSALITTRSYAAENPEIVQCTVNALTEALAFWKENKTETVDAAVKYSAGMDRASVEALWDLYAPDLPDVGTIDREALANHQELSQEQKVKDLNVDDVIDNSFAENVTLKE